MKKGVLVLIFITIIFSVNFVSATCTFRRLDWGPGTIVENTDATINIGIEGDTCQGKVISLSVKEYDKGQTDDTPTNQPTSVTIGSNSPSPGVWVFAGGTWRAQFMEDVDHVGETNPPEYYIIATLDGVTATTREDRTYVFSNQYMSVTKYVAPVPQCTNNTWCQTYYGSSSVCLNGNCTASTPPIPPPSNSSGNSTVYIPKSCSNSEIKKTWDSVFRENSDGIRILSSNVSLSPDNSSCPYYFASKISGNDVTYMLGSHIWLIFDMTLLYASKIKATPEFIGLINNYTNVSDTEASSKIMDLESVITNYTLMRNTPLSLSSANQTFLSAFKINPLVWIEKNFTDLRITEVTYSFNDTQNTSEKIRTEAGIVTKNREYVSFTFLNVTISDFNLTDNNVTTREDAINAINKSQKELKDFKNKTLSYPLFYRESIENAVDVVGMQRQIDSLRSSLNASNSSSDYQRIINLSNALNIPRTVSTTGTADTINFFPSRESINPGIIADNTVNGVYDPNKDEDYRDAILIWHQKNVDMFIDFEEISVSDDYGINPLVRVFRIGIDDKTQTGENLHFAVRKLENLRFDRNYGETESGNYVHISALPGTIITFSTTEDVDFSDLPAFVSPDLSALSLVEPPSPGDDKTKSKWWLFLIIFAIIVVIGAIGYISINRWYKNKYEIHLFKTKNNLFNILSYINNSKKSGKSDIEVRNKLKQSGWTWEQIDYAIKKYYGDKIFMVNSGAKKPPRQEFAPRR